MSETSSLDIATADGTAVLTMRNPGKKNAFDAHLLDLLHGAITDASDDPAVRAIVLTGHGDAFCAGGDVSAMGGDQDATDHLDYLTSRIHRVPLDLMASPKPTIAMINGPAVGAGLDIALACDLRVAAESAVLREAYIRVGLAAGDGGAWLLPRIVGRGVALELLLTARPVRGEEAKRIGLVTESVPDSELRERTMALAARLAEMPPNALAAMKSLVNDCDGVTFEAGLRRSGHAVAVLQSSREHTEAIRALRAQRREQPKEPA
ncbi:enoyl-CoA hydratase/isomerase family protein [Streptomyces sp. NPDC006527]|uniref:enoyl-CoA hydratase/isomerase family protein n=1 Tax=Streptomyces sp. NPDC006527 TaxID=3364749 RepID=UPI0036BCA354